MPSTNERRIMPSEATPKPAIVSRASDLIDRISHGRFLGREFLIWLWFESEVWGGELERAGTGVFEIHLDTQIVLALDKEQSRLKGRAPSGGREAREALRQGKTPTHARLRLTRGEHDYAFQLTADTLGLSSVKIPSHVKDEKHDQFYERMYLIEELEVLLDGLYSDFLALRLGKAWHESILPVIQVWVREEEVDSDAYGRARSAALKKKKPKVASTEDASMDEAIS
jgi:hypothetical protein